MTPHRPLLAAALLVLAAGCRYLPEDKDPMVYAPREEGLTLSYEDPSLQGQARQDGRLQIRVEGAKPVAGSQGVLRGTFRNTRLKGEDLLAFEVKDGGLRISDAQNRTVTVLPEGFPDRVALWGDRQEALFRVIGRGTSSHFDRILPKDAPRVGLWVERQPGPGRGPRTRTFMLPDIGTAEVLEWRGGAWVSVLRLVGRGFTDVPQSAPAPAPASPAPRTAAPGGRKA
jgi:hypothetical protein